MCFVTNLEPDSGNVTDGVTLTTESRDQHFVVLLDVVQTTVTRHERCHLLAVLDKLHSDALTDSGVRLFGFNTTTR